MRRYDGGPRRTGGHGSESQENLQTTPIAASALNATEIERKSVRELADLQYATPSMSVTSQGLTQNVNIRGIGLNIQSPAVVAGVATYRDGLFQPPILTSDPFYDTANVEVLRGPQGTFVGSNSTGGAVFITSRSPDLDGFSGNLQVQGGNYDNYLARGAVNLPLGAKTAARVAFNYEHRDSFFDQVGTDPKTPGGLSQGNVRVGFLWEPSDAVQVLLKSEYNRNQTGGFAYKPIAGTPAALFAPADPFTINYDTHTRGDELGSRNGLEVKWQLSPDGITLRSLTGFQVAQTKLVFDIDATTGPPFPFSDFQNQNIIEHLFSQEFNLLSPASGRLQWVVGAFYVNDPIGTVAQRTVVDVHVHTRKETEALFGQISYALTDALQLQVGARYSWDQQNQSGRVLINGASLPSDGGFSDRTPSGKVALNWTVNADNFLYVFAARGYKSGGFNNAVSRFDGESVWDYEAGWKSTAFEGHLRTQLGGFYMDYQKMQQSRLDIATGLGGVANVGGATIKGIELQLQAQVGGLRVDAGTAYVDSSVSQFSLVNMAALPFGGAVPLGPQCSGGATPPACFNYTPFIVNVAGRPNPYSPKWTVNAGLEYGARIGAGTLTPRVDYSYLDSQFTTLVQAPRDYLPSRGIWNARLSYALDRWQIQTFVTNFTDKTYIAGQFNGNNYFFGSPRQYGARVSMDF